MSYSRRKWLQQGFWAATAASMPIKVSLPYLTDSDRTAQDYVRLNWNENPYGPSDKVKEVLMKGLSESNHYGDPDLNSLKKQIASKYHCEKKNVLITSGSTEILGLLGQHVGLMKGEIVHSDASFPTLVMFGMYSGATTVSVPLAERSLIDLDAIKSAVSDKTLLVFICNPNNPTSTEVNPDTLREFCRSIPEHVMICVDEAYIQFAENGEASSVSDLVTELSNLIVCRTFSKAMGIAGLRIGFALSNEQNINALRKLYTGMEFCTNILAAKAAQVALKDDEFINHVVTQNQKGRDILYNSFDRWGVGYAKSATNFVYTESKKFAPDFVSKIYADHNIKITKWPSMTDHIRISIGRPDEMELFVSKAEEYLV